MTSFNLTKNVPFSLTKSAPSLRKIKFGLGWDENRLPGQKSFDLDASAIVIGSNGMMIDPANYVGYVGYVRPDYSVHGVSYGGDNRTGSGDGDDEFIEVDLDKVGPEVDKIAIAVTIYAGRTRRQSFGQVRNAYIRLHNIETDAEVARLNLTTDSSSATAIIFGELTRRNGNEWEFVGSQEEVVGGLSGVCGKFGLNITEEVDQG